MLKTLCYLGIALSMIPDSLAFVRTTTNEGIPALWYTRCIPIWLHQSGSRVLRLDEVEDDLIASLAAWEGIDCSDLGFAYQGYTTEPLLSGYDTTPGAVNQNIVSFVHQVASWIDDPRAAGITIVTMCANDTPSCAAGTVVDADILVNEAYFDFTTSQAQNIRMDLANTLTHEIGHLIGLDHSPVPLATMYDVAPYGETIKRTLDRDDLDGLCSIFSKDRELECTLNSYEFPVAAIDQTASMTSSSSGDQGCQQKSKQLTFTLLFSFIFIWITGSLNTRKKNYQRKH